MTTKTSKTWTYQSTKSDSVKACADDENQVEAWGYQDQVVQKINLVTEELFQNTIYHGTPSGAIAAVEIGLSDKAGTLTLNYREQAPYFNPLEYEYDDTEKEKVGGRGILLIRGLAADACYERDKEWNTLKLVFKL